MRRASCRRSSKKCSHASSLNATADSTVCPLSWKTCFIQKHAVELLSSPSRARWSSSVAPAGSLMTGADCLNTLPPRSSTKWLWVATKAKAIESGVRSLFRKNSRYSHHGQALRSTWVFTERLRGSQSSVL